MTHRKPDPLRQQTTHPQLIIQKTADIPLKSPKPLFRDLSASTDAAFFAKKSGPPQVKRTLSILPVALAALLLVLFHIIPHHHHREMICLAVELCEQDQTINDEHTRHHGHSSQEENTHPCFADLEYTQKILSPQKAKSLTTDTDGLFSPPCFLAGLPAGTHILPIRSITRIVSTPYRRHLPESDPQSRPGLRAPPRLIS